MYQLPKKYYSREISNHYIDGHDSIPNVIYQPTVYNSVFELYKRTGAKYIVDIGCGDGSKLLFLSKLDDNISFILIDHEYIIENVVAKIDKANYIKSNFELEMPEVDDDILSDSIVVCSDVVEHLLIPDLLLEYLSYCSSKAKGVVISTPDRVQERGLLDFGPPANPFHIREWSLDEFTRLLLEFNFSPIMMSGLTFSNNVTYNRATLICIISKYFSIVDDGEIKTQEIYFDFEFKNHELNKCLKCVRELESNVSDDCWYILKNSNAEYLPVNLRLSLDEQIKIASVHGFNMINATSINIDNNNDFKHGPARIITRNESSQKIAIVKGSLINKKEMVKLYPINVISNYFEMDMPSINKHLLSSKDYQLGNWHENITRKDYLLELAFGSEINNESNN